MTIFSLPQANGRQAIRALEKAGFLVRRQKGSHVILVHSVDLARRAIVPMHGSKSLKPGTLRAILKGAGVTIEEFTGLLK